jgi:glucose/arabinose dehydrogenase/chitodextrinase
MKGLLEAVNRLTRPFINRASRRQHENAAGSDSDSARKLSPCAPLIFETLEPRLLLAADPLGITAGAPADTTSPTVSLTPPASMLADTVNLAATTTGTVVINGGAVATNSRTVTLTLSTTDAVTQMRFSNNGNSYSTAEAFAPTKTWTLSGGAGTKTVYAQFRDAAGNWSTAATDTIVLDTTAPNISGRTATNITGSSAQISWTTNEAATSRVEYGLTTSYGSLTTLDATLVTAHSVALTGLVPNTTYNYRVRSIDAAGNEAISANSTFRTAAASDTIPPSTPTGLTATAVSATQINLSWNASTDNVAVTGYQIFRNGTQVGTSTTTTFGDTGLSPSTPYSYTVRAVDAAANASGQSAPASATTLTPDTTLPTATITAPTGSAPVSGTVTISANASDNIGVGGVTFLVDNVVVGGGEDTTSPYSVSWDTTTVPNGVHTIIARARDTSNNAADSSPVSVTVSNTQLSGLVAAYSFDEGTGATANDSSGQANTATLINGVAWVAGQHGKAASFDGVNDYITIPNSASTNISGSSLTLSMWINPQPLASGDSVVIGKFWNTTMSSPYYQYGLELAGGTVPNFLVGTTSGVREAAMTGQLPLNQWSYLAVVFNGTQAQFYVNGALISTQALSATIVARGNPINIGADASPAQFYKGLLDDLRIYSRVLTQAQIQSDMTTPAGGAIAGSPQVSIASPTNGAQVSGIINVTADATDDTGIANVQFYVDNVATGSPDTTNPYALAWDTRTVSNGAHSIAALATDIDGHTTLSAPVAVNVANGTFFQNEILATGFNLPTAIKFLPDGRMLVVELAGTIRVLPPPYTTPDPTPFLQLTNIGSAGVQQGIYDIALDPNFSTNHYYYIFYTLRTPNVDRFSRFTANATLTGTVAGSEFVIYQDPEIASSEHHGGAINFSNDGKILITTGEHFNAAEAQDLTKPRGKILRYNMDGTVPTDNPFYDGAGPNFDAIWALGLRNPYRAYYDAPTGRLIIGDVGGNDYSTAIEEVDIGARGANYGWPNVEAPNGNSAYTAPAYYYPHNGRDAAITGGFVYHGTQFPAAYQGSYFFADYTQNWIRRLTFDSNGNVSGVFNFEPADGSVDGPYGDIVYLTEGPDGALYYVDLGYSDISGTFGVSKIRRIEFFQSDLPPVAAASASPTQGPTPLTVNFSSAGSSDPEGKPLTYSWNFGDGAASTQANPSHTYTVAGPYQARLTVSDGVNSTLSTPIAISAGSRPVVTLSSPTDGAIFRAGDVITFSGTATDAEDGTLPASAYTWNIDFLHEGHIHPGTPITGVTSGTFTIPTSGHDFSGFTRYRVTLTVTDSSGLQSSQFVTIFPDKVNLTFDTAPGGLTLYLDGIAHTAPFVYDTLKGFNHTIEARDQTVGTTSYTFASWSDGGTQQHTLVVPDAAQTYTATFSVATAPTPLAFVQANAATPQTNQTQVSVAYTSAQVAGDTNILVIGWNNATSNITSVTDSAGNIYQLAVPTVRGSGISQAIYYAKNIKSAAAGANTVTVTFNTATQYVDIRALEYSGLDLANPFDVGASASGTSNSANSGAVTTTAAHELIIGAGTTTGGFSAAGSGFTTRVITSPDGDIAEDRFVTATGSYGATASLGGSAAWVMQVATFKAAIA